MSRSDEVRQQLVELLAAGEVIQSDLLPRKDEEVANHFSMIAPYQKWYSAASETVRVLLRGRFDEFVGLYEGKRTASVFEYGISMWLKGKNPRGSSEYAAVAEVFQLFMTQLEILRSAQESVDAVLFDIEGLVQADLFSNELDGAVDLLKAGHIRAAGVVAGVVVERHIKQVALHHGF